MAHQEPPPAAAAAAAATVPPAPPEGLVGPPRTYRALYADAAYNPAPDRIAGFLAGYRFSGDGDIPTPAQLRDQTVALSDRQPMAFLCLVPGQDGVPDEVSVVHRLLRYVDTPGDDDSGFHDSVLGLLGDINAAPVSGGGSTEYHIPPSGFPGARGHGSRNGDTRSHVGGPTHATGAFQRCGP